MEDATIISVSTGTKCVNGEHMSETGNSLNGKTKTVEEKHRLLFLSRFFGEGGGVAIMVVRLFGAKDT